MKMLLQCVACCVITCGVASGQAPEATYPSVDLLNPQAQAEGSFEKGWKPRWRVFGSRGTKAKGKVLSANGDISAPDGEHYLRIDLAGGDTQRLGGKLSLADIPIDLENGRVFRIQWQARTEVKDRINSGNTSLVFFEDDETKNPLKVKAVESVAINNGTWQSYSADIVYDDEAIAKRLDLVIGFTRHIPSGRVVSGDVMIDGIRLWQINDPTVKVGRSAALAAARNSPPPTAPIPVTFTTPKDGEVTLVLEDADGVRVCNLIEGVFYKKGTHVFQWDGLDVGDNRYGAGGQAYYTLNRKIVAPGTYRVRGLVHDPLGLTYDLTAYPNIGKQNVPWPTHLHDGDGGWLADHGKPHAAAFIPAEDSPYGEDVVALAATVAEAGPAVGYVNMEGKKLGGVWRLGGDWTGASHFATDRGAERNPSIFMYSAKAWQPKRDAPENSVLLKILGLTKQGTLEVDYLTLPLPDGKTWKDAGIVGLAAHNGLLAFGEQASGTLYLYDTSQVSVNEKGTLLKRLELADVSGLAFAPDGALLALVNKSLRRYVLDRKNGNLGRESVLVSDGLVDPKQLMVAEDGRIFVSDWGNSCQVKIFTPDGKPTGIVGTAGPVRSGPYVKSHLNHPFGLALDSRGRLWVAENCRLPKRVSVWNLETRQLVRAFYGPTEYGGGGVLDPRDPSIVYYTNAVGCMSFKLDRKQGEGMPHRVLFRNDEFEATGGNARFVSGNFPLYAGARRYLTNAYSGPTTGAIAIEFWLDGSESAQPMTFIGGLRGIRYFAKDESRLGKHFSLFTDQKKPMNARELRLLTIKRSGFLSRTLACWTDSSNDGKIDQNEMSFLSFADRDDVGLILSANIGKDFEILITHEQGVMRIPTDGFSPEGHPLYDLGKVEHPVTGLKLRGSSGGNQAVRCSDGGILITGGPMQKFVDGRRVWRVHSQWPSLHAGHAAPSSPEYPGQLVSTTRLLGPMVTPRSGDAGQVWGINSDKGVMYLLTDDGLFLSTLGQFGHGTTSWVMKEHNRGMDLTGVNHLSENFYPTLNQGADGSLTVISGKTHISLLKLTGLESVQRFSADDLVVDGAVIAKAKAYGRACADWQREGEGSGELTVARLSSPIKVDGNLEEWNKSSWVTVSRVTEQHGWGRPVKVPESEAAWAVDKTHLYIAIRSQRDAFMENSGQDPQTFFSTGGGVDLRLAAKVGSARQGKNPAPVTGDLRMVLARHEGKATAFLYRGSVPGTTDPVRFSSPVGTVLIDAIDDVSDQVSLATGSTLLASIINAQKKIRFATMEVSIPLETLGWDPQALPKTTGDIGLLFGNEGRTVERSYWHNKGAGIVSDLPSEASLDVGQWGPVVTFSRK
jgi:hypothetical protein